MDATTEAVGRRCGVTIKDEICPQVNADVRLCDDGTLWIKTDKIADIGRVIVEDGKTLDELLKDDPGGQRLAKTWRASGQMTDKDIWERC